MTMMTVSRPTTRTRSSIWSRLTRLYGVWVQRQALRSLDDVALNDIGLTRFEAETEARRPLWDAPEIWRD